MVHSRQLEAAYQRETGTYHFACFDKVIDYLNDADYTVGNLETTFAGEGAGYATYPLFNSPDAFADALKDAGFEFLSTANNHCYDKREKGLLRTLDILDERGIAHAGTYRSQEDRSEIFIKEINGIRIAFLSFTYSTNGIVVAADKPWLVNMLDEELMREQIGQARSEADVVVVLPHMGDEYREAPAARYIGLAHSMCEWGADAVMANHPHVLQPTEFFEADSPDGKRDCFIAYSMGNFISGQRTVPRDTGAVFYLEFEKEFPDARVELKSASFVPTWVRFVNATGSYAIETLPIYDALHAAAADIQRSDVERMKAAHKEVLRKMLGREETLDEMRPVYEIIPFVF